MKDYTLRDFLERINKFVEDNPHTLDMIVILEDEGGFARRINFLGFIGYFDNSNEEFTPEEDLLNDEPINSVRIN